MGLFTSIFGGVAATSAANRLNPPTVIMRDVNFGNIKIIDARIRKKEFISHC